MSEYLPEFSRLRRLVCVAVGHELVKGRGFIVADEAIDLKWEACRRCFMWRPEGGVKQLEHEIQVAKELHR